MTCDKSSGVSENQFMPDDNGTLRVGVVGAGAFGRNHARVYRDLAADPANRIEFSGVADPKLASAQSAAREFKTSAFQSAAELIAQGVDAVSVAVPTVLHLAVARELMQSGVDVLIEKPLAASIAEAEELITVAEAYGRIAQVGHLERFNPAVRATFRCSPNRCSSRCIA